MAKLKDLKDLVQNVNLTEEQIAELHMLTKGVPEKVEFQKLKYRPFPFDTKNIVRVVTISA